VYYNVAIFVFIIINFFNNITKMTQYRKIITFFLLLATILQVQGQSKQYIKDKKEIDSLYEIFRANQSTDAFKGHHYRLKKSESIQYNNGMLGAYLGLMYKHACDANKDSLIYYCNKFESLEKLHPNKLMRIGFLSYKGQGLDIYWGLHEEAIKCYLEAYQLIKEVNGDVNRKISNIRLIASFYNTKNEHNKALKLLLEQLKDSSALKYDMKMFYLLEISNTYQYKKMPEKSSLFNSKLLKLSLKNKDRIWYLRSKNEQFEDYFLKGNYKKVIDSGLVLHKEILQNNSSGLRDVKINNNENLSDAYGAVKDYKKAIFYLKEAISIDEISDRNINLYDKLANFYELDNDLKQALNIYKKKSIITDTTRVRERKTFVDYYKNQVNTINVKEEAENIKLKAKIIGAQNKRQKLYISLLLISLISVGSFVGLFIISKKYEFTKNKVAILKQNEVNILKNHIKVRENELSAILISEAKKTEQLDQIKTTLVEAIKNNDTVQMKVAQKSLNKYLKASEEFGLFSERLESQYPGIIHQLKESHPDLSQNDIRHCLLVKLGLSLKESAQLLNVTYGTVKNSRNRVMRKLDLPKNVNLQKYLDQIEGNANLN
jgi:DNA-binding CsgD family transcriptional regulator